MNLPPDPTSDLATSAQRPPSDAPLPTAEITGAILAGGLGRRMGGQDKGLLEVAGRSLIAHIIDSVRPQVGPLMINANRNLDRYREFGLPVIQDTIGQFFGPLVGMASALQAAHTPYLLTLPCDSPLVPTDLCARLYRALQAADAEIGVAHDGTRMQPVFALLRRELLPDLLGYLENGGRKIDTWFAERRFVMADFSDRPDAFLNVNTPEELTLLEAAQRNP